MKILRRYILREHLGPFIAALGVLTGLMLLNQLARRFGDLVGKGLPWYVICEVFALSIPFITAMSIPMAVLVAVLYSFSRLTGDNEVTAFKAGGVSLLRLMLPVLFATSILAGGMVWFNDKILPESNHALRQLLTDIGRKRPTFELRERVVNEVVDKKLFLQAAQIDRMRSVLWDMVIFDLGRPNVNRTIYADSGYMAFNQTQTDLYLTLFDGSMHELDTQDPGMDQRTYYEKQVIRVPDVSNELERGRSADWRGDREMSIAMMREEIESRHERFTALQDSVDTVISSLTPIRVPPDTVSEKTESRDAGSPATDRRKRALEDERAESEVQDSIPSSQPDVSSTPEAEALRRRYRRPARVSEWPPQGDPVAFASQVRSRMERIASRKDMQRREMNRYEVEIQKKFAIPAAAIVFVLIGAPVAVRFPRGGIGMVIGVSLTVFSSYYIFLIGGEDIADRGFLSPFWAMWAPNALFTGLGIILLYIVTLGGTKRLTLARLMPWYRQAKLAAAATTTGRRPIAEVAEAATQDPDLALPPIERPEAGYYVDSRFGPVCLKQHLLDINKATAEELERLAGLSPSLAARVVSWREQHGPFEKLADLLDVPRLGPVTLALLEGKARVGRDDA
jgi:lipopolysaccharide export system permease protein